MKRLIELKLLIIVSFALCSVSCSKKNNPPPPPTPPDYKTLLIGKTWSAVKLARDINANGKIDDGETYSEPVNTYDYITFMANGTALIEHSDGKSTTNAIFSWELFDQQTIRLDNQVLKLTHYWHIKTLTTNQFNFDQYLVDNMTLDAGLQCLPK